MPPGATPMTRQMPPGRRSRKWIRCRARKGPFNSQLPLGHVPIAGQIAYALDPEWIDIANGWTATEKTYVEFKGRTAWAQRSQIPFHVTSLDWQESDRVLAGIMTAFGAPTGAIDIGGRGEFDGVHARVVLEAAHRGALRRRPHARLGHDLGPRRRRPRHRERLRRHQEERHRARGIADRRRRASSRSASRARTAARRSTRTSG